jgi:hypothetical protein
VHLEDEANLMAQQMQSTAMAMELDAIDRYVAAVGFIKPSKKVQQRTFATA